MWKTGKKLPLVLTGVVLTVLTLASSCNKDMFAEDAYENLVKNANPIDSLDAGHQWNLLQSKVAVVIPNVPGLDDVAQVQVLNGNPYDGSASAEVMGLHTAKAGERTAVAYRFGKSQPQLYAAVVTSAGKYYVKAFTTGDGDVSFDRGNVISQGVFHKPKSQTYTYIYETSFPLPDDFDFNDVVLRLSMETPSDTLLRLKVTLVAVGTLEQMAAAVRLPGVKSDQVKSVTIEEGNEFDDGFTFQRAMLPSEETLMSSRSDEAVIRLFEDAHWSMSPRTEEMGGVRRRYYNTEISSRQGYSAKTSAKMRTYDIVFKDGFKATNLELADMDPFVVHGYNGGMFEVHIHRYKLAEVIWGYTSGDPNAYNDHMAWALLIPDDSFKYPIEGTPLGTYRNGLLAGAYSLYRHSFGEWGRNQYVATDWWLHPNYGYYVD
ncbi:MAG: LruC domain-containing protein [Prevotella sp.]|nr:LruC domain-containing protein [Prevotella sp.]